MNRTTHLVILECPDCGKELLEFDPRSGIYHCTNPNCKFQYFDKNTGKKYRRMMRK
jgi:ssDNA-binding Zn-finger/Zn-ribbon topoisomerase 1